MSTSRALEAENAKFMIAPFLPRLKASRCFRTYAAWPGRRRHPALLAGWASAPLTTRQAGLELRRDALCSAEIHSAPL